MDGAEIKSPKRWEFSIYQTRAQWDQRFALMLWAHFGVSLLLAFVATLYPSWRASRINPAEALRYE